jgi:molybdate transport system ATP-binding protein
MNITQLPAGDDSIVSLESATVVRAGGEVALSDFTWTVREGETWAVVGRAGSGKTTLAEVVLGKHRVDSGAIRWPLLDRLRAAGHKIGRPSDVIRLVSFKEDTRLFSYGRHYYQQRFNFVEPRDDLTLDTFLRFGLNATDEELHAAAEQVGLRDLLPLSLIKLSNGQIRRARLARALLARPEWLLLDEPFMGLDRTGREDIAKLLGNFIQLGARVLLITRPDAIPEWITHVLELDRLGIRALGPKANCNWQAAGGGSDYSSSSYLQSAICNRQLSEPLLELRNVTVAYDRCPILDNVSWIIRAGDRWALLGPNGAGKSTLLSLICGDHPQAYSNDIRLFGQPRGAGESIWDIKRRIGFVSSELHLYYSESLTAVQTAATGFFDVLAFRTTTPDQDAVVRDLFDQFEIAPLADRPFAQLSTGEQRLVLLIRALVKDPDVLILDEPFQGLDERMIHRASAWVDHNLRPQQTVIFVSHYEDEIPRTVARQLWLEQGRVVKMM